MFGDSVMTMESTLRRQRLTDHGNSYSFNC